MKKIVLEIEDNVFKQIMDCIGTKKLLDNFCGASDEFCAIIINSILQEEKLVTIVSKE